MTQEQAEDCPLTIIRDQMRGIHEDIADLMAYAQGQIDEQNKKDDESELLRRAAPLLLDALIDLRAVYIGAVYDSMEEAGEAKNPVIIKADAAIMAAVEERWVKKPIGSLGNYYAKDGTLMNADGTRSIFDDVDQ